jgi:hypothetical protein
MIIKEEYKTRTDGVKLFRIYSDAGKSIIQNESGVVYTEAIDVETAPYTYSEYEAIVDPEDTTPEVPEGADESIIMTRAQLTDKVNELDEAIGLILSRVTE